MGTIGLIGLGGLLLVGIAAWNYLHFPSQKGDSSIQGGRFHTPHPPAAYRLTQPDGVVPSWAATLQAAGMVLCLVRIGQRFQLRRHPATWVGRAALHGTFWVWALGSGPMGHDRHGPWPVFASPAWAFCVGGTLGVLWTVGAVSLATWRSRLPWIAAEDELHSAGGLARSSGPPARPPSLVTRDAALWLGLVLLAASPWTDSRLIAAWTWEPADYARCWLELLGGYFLLASSAIRFGRERLGELARGNGGLRWLAGDLAVCWTGLLAATGFSAAVQWYRTPLPNLNVIVPGRLYRSGYPRYRDLALAQPRLKLRTIVNLDGGNEEPSWREERRYIREHGIRYLQARVSECPLERWAELFASPDAFPMLIHCQQGLHRSTALVALYRMLEQGWTLERALGEIERTSGDSTKPILLDWLRTLDRQRRSGKAGQCSPRAAVAPLAANRDRTP